MNSIIRYFWPTFGLACFLCAPPIVKGQGTAFTYHGRLTAGATAASGAYDFRFSLFDALANGSPIGGVVISSSVPVTDGSFIVSLNFGAGAFSGANRWLQIEVRTNTASTFTTLEPRQALTASPYAITAGDVTGGNVARLNAPNTVVAATGAPTVSFGFIVNVTLTSGGTGYTAAPVVTVNDTTGFGAIITATVSGGVVTALAVQNPGGGYSAGATLTIAAPPPNASQTFGTPNLFTGANTMNNPNNAFSGTFAGNGSGLTALNGGAISAGTIQSGALAGGQVVKSVNGMKDAVTFSAGENITLTPNGSDVLIASTAAGGISWQVVAGVAQQAQPNRGYLLSNNAEVTVTLPASPNPGDLVRVSGSGTSGWKIAQNANQSVLIKNLPANSAGASWTPRDSARTWSSVASSADGTKLAATTISSGGGKGRIYTSTDSGATWTPHGNAQNWLSVASSADGAKLVAATDAAGGQLFTSTDSGVTWTPREGGRPWFAVASSADGVKLMACIYLGSGLVYTSANSGVSWGSTSINADWTCVASSADGAILYAGAVGSPIYMSINSGASWNPLAGSGTGTWLGIACSADGIKVIAVDNDLGRVYVSENAGATWTPREGNRHWTSVACSADGTKIVAAAQGEKVYTSSDSGGTWEPHAIDQDWSGVACSADGVKIVAVAGNNGLIYSSLSGSSNATSSVGVAGYLIGEANAAIELQYVGGGQFMPISHEGIIVAH